MDENTKLLKKISEELNEIKFWMKLSGIPNLQRVISSNLRNDEDKIVYDFSDGTRSTRDIVVELKKTGRSITHTTVANMWKRWSVAGIVVRSEKYKGRFKKIISLESLGIDVPIAKNESEKNEQK